ncbi:MAG: helix-hairpin-helix domain-containing protein [Eubacteriales bacterium]|nr:helix-hairpin-helix domain-containing protein [Eubacteriales bacterium]
MMKGRKVLGIFIILALLCSGVVLIMEEIAYTPNSAKFEEIITDTENAINLNSATSAELQKLDGIGEKTADKIIKFRERVRRFETIHDIKLVKGYGEILFETNKCMITVK